MQIRNRISPATKPPLNGLMNQEHSENQDIQDKRVIGKTWIFHIIILILRQVYQGIHLITASASRQCRQIDWDHEVKNFSTSRTHTMLSFPLKIIASTRIKGPFLIPTLPPAYNTKITLKLFFYSPQLPYEGKLL